MVKLVINQREIEVAPGTTVLQAALQNGIAIPHYCWHPGLSLAGNCRMCLVKLSTSRKLEPSCMVKCEEKMVVETETPEVKKARRDILEFQLINHPLDCPVCDKAGECDLQDYTFTFRDGLSRFREKKVIKHTKSLGPTVKIWGNRCIVCTRCVRFCDEVAGSGELTVVNRGEHSVVDAFPGVPLENKLSLNTVDICPVGALIGKDFLYKARVWFTGTVDTICPSCSRGCNVKVSLMKGKAVRLEPRVNMAVNGYWMCDDGRLNYQYLNSEKRLKEIKGAASLSDAVRGLKDKIKSYGGGSFAMVVSTYQTLESMALFKKVSEVFNVKTIAVATVERGAPEKFKGGFVINPDKTPNRRGAELLFGSAPTLNTLGNLAEAIRGGKIKSALIVNGIPDPVVQENLAGMFAGLEYVAVIDILQSRLTEIAHLCIPAAAYTEKDGTFVNDGDLHQRIRRGTPPPGEARSEDEILQRLLAEAGERSAILSTEGVMKEMGAVGNGAR